MTSNDKWEAFNETLIDKMKDFYADLFAAGDIEEDIADVVLVDANDNYQQMNRYNIGLITFIPPQLRKRTLTTEAQTEVSFRIGYIADITGNTDKEAVFSKAYYTLLDFTESLYGDLDILAMIGELERNPTNFCNKSIGLVAFEFKTTLL